MMYFTPQERRALLFLAAVLCSGLGIAAYAALNPRYTVPEMIQDCVKINLNRVSCDALIRSRIVPRKLAGKIIEYRAEHGIFSDMDQLRAVKGLGERRLRRLKEVCYAGAP